MLERSTELAVIYDHAENCIYEKKKKKAIKVVFQRKFEVMESLVCFLSLGLANSFPLMELMEDDQKIFRSKAAT